MKKLTNTQLEFFAMRYEMGAIKLERLPENVRVQLEEFLIEKNRLLGEKVIEYDDIKDEFEK